MLDLSPRHRLARRNALCIALALALPAAEQGQAQAGKDNSVVDIDELQVEGTRPLDATGEMRDIQGYDDVYSRNLSTAYIGKEMVERFKGAAPADVLKGLPNVHSGDARNSGALDPNIRGIQGPGRVPVTIDGTEQALTVWRGYNGVNNRNYIDPNLIGGIQVFKGPNLERDVLTSVGGAVAIKTIDADDILRDGQNFGMELRLEGSNNSIAPRLPTLLTGRHVDDVKAEYPGWNFLRDNSLHLRPHTSGSNHLLTVKDDLAYRAAVAGRLGNVNLMAAYAYRDKGNHFAGTHAAGHYMGEVPRYNYEKVRRLALSYRPGDEVPNTSSEMESWLFKATWKPTDRQQLQLGYRSTLSHYGEIMPSRIHWNDAREFGVPQWPLSRVDMTAYNLKYRWVADHPWLDFHANLWRTDTVSDGYNSGGFPNYYSRTDPIIRNTAVVNALNDRNGITLSNRIQFSDTLNLTIGGNFQHEKLGSRDPGYDSDNNRISRRIGRREEYDLHFNVEWQPLQRLTLAAGARYSSYWSMDDLLAESAAAGTISPFFKTKGFTATYWTKEEIFSEAAIRRRFPSVSEAELQYLFKAFAKQIAEGAPWPFGPAKNYVEWRTDANGRFHRADNPCTNGMLDGIPDRVPSITNPDLWCTYGSNSEDIRKGLIERITLTSVDKLRGHGWAPAFSAAWQLGDNARLYARHSQAIRYPSMFESTFGFSASPTKLYTWGIKPEHTYNNEIAYAHDLKSLLSADGYANIKLAYFHHRTKNAIDRDGGFQLSNLERHTIRGIEFQGRFDNGFFLPTWA